MKHPTISVIIPLFNCERYIAEAIDSALRQTYPPLEIVVVNDGSTDSGPAIVESYGDRVRMITQANGGQSSARNTAIAAARGEWVALLDSDDYWLPNKLEMQVAALAASERADLVCTGWVELHSDGTTEDIPMGDVAWIKQRLLYAVPMFPSTVMMRRSIMIEEPWNTAQRSSEDWQMFYRLSRRVEFARVEACLTVYRVIAGSVSNSDWRNALKYAKTVAKEIQNDVGGMRGWLLRRRIDGRLYANAALGVRDAGEKGSLGWMTRSLWTWPFPDVMPKRYKIFVAMAVGSLRGR